LFSSKLTDLSQALRPNNEKFVDKSVKSVQSRVTNIEHHLPQKLSVTDFMNLIETHVLQDFPNAECREFSNDERKKINELGVEKYQTRDWNFGKSPAYTYSQRLRTQAGGSIELYLVVKNSIIENVQFFGDFFEQKDINEIVKRLTGAKHERSEIEKKLNNLNISEYFKHVSQDEFIRLF
jgi:lipoate-protein ligase A